MSGETAKEAFDRGEQAGQIAARLAGHDKHFSAINGQLGKIGEEMHELVLAVQRLGDAAASDRTTVITTASALKEAESARRDKTEASWSPLQRASLVLAVLGGLVGLYLAFRPGA